MKHFFPKAFIIEISGKDSTRYLQARLSNNVAALDLGKSCKASALNHQGKPLGIFYVYKKSTEEYLLIAEGNDQDEILKSLMQFKVAERVTPKILTDHKVVHLLDSIRDEIKTPIITSKRTTLDGFDTIVATEDLESLLKDSTLIDEATEQKERILAGSPLYPNELSSNRILLESGATNAISFTKGCYLGQEVLEKIDSHGKAPSMLISYKSSIKELPLDDTVTDKQENQIGKIVSSIYVPSEETSYAFIRVRNKGEVPESLMYKNEEMTLVKNQLLGN